MKKLIISCFLFGIFSSYVFSEELHVEDFKSTFSTGYSQANGGGNHRYILTNLDLKWYCAYNDSKFIVSPYVHTKRNKKKNHWERNEIGLGIGKDIFDFLYLGGALQLVDYYEDIKYYKGYESGQTSEFVANINLEYPFLSIWDFKLEGYVTDEYKFDIFKREPTFNDITMGLSIIYNNMIKTSFGWRHHDRIEYYDSDLYEIIVSASF